MRVLECSSREDKRFSALYAQVKAFGKEGTIESHYQSCKRDAAGNVPSKGKPVDHIILNGRKLEARFLTQWYTLLWIKYLDLNPDLVEVLRQYDDYSDMFKGKSINCQADTIRAYMRSRSDLIASASELRGILQSQ